MFTPTIPTPKKHSNPGKNDWDELEIKKLIDYKFLSLDI